MAVKQNSELKLAMERIKPLNLATLGRLKVDELKSTSFGGGQMAIKPTKKQPSSKK